MFFAIVVSIVDYFEKICYNYSIIDNRRFFGRESAFSRQPNTAYKTGNMSL